jgi:hypothetical protein
MKFQFMKDHNHHFAVGRMSKVLGVSRSGYYAFSQSHSGKRAQENAYLGILKIIAEGLMAV